MVHELVKKVAFPEGFPEATAGVLLLERKLLITGHENGFVVKWNLDDHTHEILFDSDSSVTTMSKLGDKWIAVGYHSGGLYVIDIDDKVHVTTVKNPEHTKYSRVWRTAWLNNEHLLITSTYGEVRDFQLEAGSKVAETYIRAHSDSVFGIDSIAGKYVATGDYKGNIVIWKFVDGVYQIAQKLNVVGNVQDICWYGEECFAVINASGRIFWIERESSEGIWQIVVEVDIAQSRGICINVTDDGETIFAGTYNEIIQFDLDSHQLETTTVENPRKIFSHINEMYILTGKGLLAFEKKPVKIARELINYKFSKISLLGHTGTGKTTFCNGIISGDVSNIYSTFGKRIFSWELKDKNGVKKRIVFHDHGGQEMVLDTFVPFLKDSDIILLFYKQTDQATFRRSLEILDEIRDKISESTRVYLIQTFVDHEMDAIPSEVIKNLIDDRRVLDVIKVSPAKKIGFDEFKEKVIETINWEKARTMIQSPFINGISETFKILQEKDRRIIPFDEFKQIYQETIHSAISVRHLRFLLDDYTNQGVIEYYPDISDLIVFNDATFNKLRTEIPIFVGHMKGLVEIEHLQKKFDHESFLKMLDEMYLKSGIAIKNESLRVFPHELSAEPLEIPEDFQANLRTVEPDTVFLRHQQIQIAPLIQLLSELSLQCIAVSKNEGLFAWEKNAFVYYFVQEERRGILEKYIKFMFSIGGTKEKVMERLKKQFSTILERLYGPAVELSSQSNKKKVQKHMNLM